MYRIFPEKKPNPTIESLKTLSEKFLVISNGHKVFADSNEKFSKSVQNLVELWAPAYGEKIKAYTDIIMQIRDLYVNLSEVENRSGEDIRDITERFLVYERLKGELEAVKEKYDNASNKVITAMGDKLYEEKRPNFEKKKESLDAAISKARSYKRLVLEEKRQALTKYIVIRESYNKFKVIRLRQAFERYSKAAIETNTREEELYRQAASILQEIREQGLPNIVSDSIQQMYSEEIEETKPDAAPISPVEQNEAEKPEEQKEESKSDQSESSDDEEEKLKSTPNQEELEAVPADEETKEPEAATPEPEELEVPEPENNDIPEPEDEHASEPEEQKPEQDEQKSEKSSSSSDSEDNKEPEPDAPAPTEEDKEEEPKPEEDNKNDTIDGAEPVVEAFPKEDFEEDEQ